MAPQKEEKIGDIFEARVRNIASDGRGVVSHPSGRTFFVPGVWLNEKVKLKITSLKTSVGFARCVDLLEASEHRVTAPCVHHGTEKGRCGGCPWQSIAYAEQLAVKQTSIRERLGRIGISDVIRDIWPSEVEYGYRNRAQFKSDGHSIGYVSPNSNTLAPITDCLILSDSNRQTLSELQQQLPNKQWRPIKAKQWTTLDIDEDTEAVSVNQRLPFLQANTTQNFRMREWLAKKMNVVSKNIEVLELFCGSGNFTEIIAKQGFKNIIAVEAVEEALEVLDARQWKNVETLKVNLFQEVGINAALHKAKNAEVLVLDPPREGLKIKGNLFSKKSNIREVFYISCDAATLIRDTEIFRKNKFKVKEIQPLDQFPHTPHVEFLVHFAK